MFFSAISFYFFATPFITPNIPLGVTQGGNLILLPMITYNFTTESSYNLTRKFSFICTLTFNAMSVLLLYNK